MNITIQQVKSHAQSGKFTEMLALCGQIVEVNSDNSDVLLDIGVLLHNFGFITQAMECFKRVEVLTPNNTPLLVNLANLARDFGDHPESRRLYAILQKQHPDNPVIRRNSLVSLEYDFAVTDAERFNMARAWGQWAVARASGVKVRPAPRPLKSRQLRIGYVSADFCQHTVGLFVKDVLKAHDPGRVAVFAYSAGTVADWVTNQIRAASTFRDVRSLDDVALARLISEDGIDILVDLSGHTAGSRLTLFAHRPAPVQVSWLGYFATTGLSY